MQQRAADRAYDRGIALIQEKTLEVAPGKFATVLGNYIDEQVRLELRAFAKSEQISDTIASKEWAIKRRLKSQSSPQIGIPDGRIGLNLFHDTTLAPKDGRTEQLQKWNSLSQLNGRQVNFLIVRPSQMPGGGSYVIPRATIQPYNSPIATSKRKL